jgi:hypothetical protein
MLLLYNNLHEVFIYTVVWERRKQKQQNDRLCLRCYNISTTIWASTFQKVFLYNYFIEKSKYFSRKSQDDKNVVFVQKPYLPIVGFAIPNWIEKLVVPSFTTVFHHPSYSQGKNMIENVVAYVKYVP